MNVPQAVGPIAFSSYDCLTILENFQQVFGKDSNAIFVAELSDEKK